MDVSALTIIASIVIALTGIIPGTLALIKQGKKDDKDAKLAADKLEFDMNNAANVALAAVIGPLKEELKRTQDRVAELEVALVNKTNQIGDLMQAGIDKDLKISLLNGNIAMMQMRLDAFEDRKQSTAAEKTESKKRRDEDLATSLARRDEDLALAEQEKEKVKALITKANKDLMEHSILNGKNKTDPPKEEVVPNG